jgi:hypothetical protein
MRAGWSSIVESRNDSLPSRVDYRDTVGACGRYEESAAIV